MTNDLENKLLQEIQRQHLSENDIKTFLASLKHGKPTEAKTKTLGKNHVRYLAMSDTHI